MAADVKTLIAVKAGDELTINVSGKDPSETLCAAMRIANDLTAATVTIPPGTYTACGPTTVTAPSIAPATGDGFMHFNVIPAPTESN